MKRIFVTQKVDILNKDERQDSLDQNWHGFLREAQCYPVLVPNDEEMLRFMLADNPPEGILLTGGNSHTKHGGRSPERDLVDKILIEYSLENNIPLIGVCRGMQSILIYFKGGLKIVKGHADTIHEVHGDISGYVKSDHTLVPDFMPPCLKPLATSYPDSSVEAIRHINNQILGIMWHPEKASPFNKDHLELFRTLWYHGSIKWDKEKW